MWEADCKDAISGDIYHLTPQIPLLLKQTRPDQTKPKQTKPTQTILYRIRRKCEILNCSIYVRFVLYSTHIFGLKCISGEYKEFNYLKFMKVIL
jgi:hypothetical protein